MDQAPPHPVLLLVSRRAKPGQEAAFEWLMAEFIACAEAFPGCVGARLVHPGDEEGVEDSLYHALIAFETPAHLAAWQVSAERAAGLVSIAPYIDGPAVERGISGLAHWFQAPAAVRPGQPPRWKVAVVTWLGIFPAVYTLFLLLGDLLAPWSLLARIALLTVLVVAIMTWGVAPQLTRLFRPWLYPAPSVTEKPAA